MQWPHAQVSEKIGRETVVDHSGWSVTLTLSSLVRNSSAPYGKERVIIHLKENISGAAWFYPVLISQESCNIE